MICFAVLDEDFSREGTRGMILPYPKIPHQKTCGIGRAVLAGSANRQSTDTVLFVRKCVLYYPIFSRPKYVYMKRPMTPSLSAAPLPDGKQPEGNGPQAVGTVSANTRTLFRHSAESYYRPQRLRKPFVASQPAGGITRAAYVLIGLGLLAAVLFHVSS